MHKWFNSVPYKWMLRWQWQDWLDAISSITSSSLSFLYWYYPYRLFLHDDNLKAVTVGWCSKANHWSFRRKFWLQPVWQVVKDKTWQWVYTVYDPFWISSGTQCSYTVRQTFYSWSFSLNLSNFNNKIKLLSVAFTSMCIILDFFQGFKRVVLA